jgi:hypothetical protein
MGTLGNTGMSACVDDGSKNDGGSSNSNSNLQVAGMSTVATIGVGAGAILLLLAICAFFYLRCGSNGKKPLASQQQQQQQQRDLSSVEGGRGDGVELEGVTQNPLRTELDAVEARASRSVVPSTWNGAAGATGEVDVEEEGAAPYEVTENPMLKQQQQLGLDQQDFDVIPGISSKKPAAPAVRTAARVEEGEFEL